MDMMGKRRFVVDAVCVMFAIFDQTKEQPNKSYQGCNILHPRPVDEKVVARSKDVGPPVFRL